MPKRSLMRDGARYYHPELDVLRFVAFALVFLSHAMPFPAIYDAAGLEGAPRAILLGLKKSGAFGVDLFFLLSAFLINEILQRERERFGSIELKAFWIRRLLRIWPLYFAFLPFAIWVVPLFLDQTFPAFHQIAFAVFLGNWSVIAQPDGFDSVASILWSVSIEEQFYLAWPLVLFFFPTRVRGICAGLIVLSVGLRAVLLRLDVGANAVWTNTFTRLDPIAVGILVSTVLGGRALELAHWKRWALAAGALVALVLVGMYVPLHGFRGNLAYPAATLAALALFVAFFGSGLSTPWLVHLGRVSYGLYVYHALAIAVARRYVELPGLGLLELWVAKMAAALVITIGLALVSYRFLEAPFLRIKERFSRA